MASFQIINRLCLERDNFTCQHCGSKERLEVHHKDNINPRRYGINKANHSLGNLITLCGTCHHHEHKRLRALNNKQQLITHTYKVTKADIRLITKLKQRDDAILSILFLHNTPLDNWAIASIVYPSFFSIEDRFKKSGRVKIVNDSLNRLYRDKKIKCFWNTENHYTYWGIIPQRDKKSSYLYSSASRKR